MGAVGDQILETGAAILVVEGRGNCVQRNLAVGPRPMQRARRTGRDQRIAVVGAVGQDRFPCGAAGRKIGLGACGIVVFEDLQLARNDAVAIILLKLVAYNITDASRRSVQVPVQRAGAVQCQNGALGKRAILHRRVCLGSADLLDALPVQRRYIGSKLGAGGMCDQAFVQPAIEAPLGSDSDGFAVLIARCILVAMAPVRIAARIPAVFLRQQEQETTVSNRHTAYAAAKRAKLRKKGICIATMRRRHIRQAVKRAAVVSAARQGRGLILAQQDIILFNAVHDERRVRVIGQGRIKVFGFHFREFDKNAGAALCVVLYYVVVLTRQKFQRRIIHCRHRPSAPQVPGIPPP